MDNVDVFTSEASRCVDVAYPIIGEVYFWCSLKQSKIISWRVGDSV